MLKKMLLGMALAACAWMPAPRARCTYCLTTPCFGRCLGSGCLCMQQNPGEPGTCVYFR